MAALLLNCAPLTAQDAAAQAAPIEPSRWRSAEDGAFDLSGFLDEAHGFVPVFIPITEPAVGIGGALGLVFIDKGQGGNRPDISAVGGMRTDNGTDGLFLGDSRYWRDGRVQTLAAVFDAGINLQFYGAGAAPRNYGLDMRGGVVLGKWLIGDSKSWFGVGYALADTTARFDIAPGLPQLPDIEGESRAAALVTSLTHDGRDNLFTPSSGNYLDASVALFSETLGSDADYQRVSLTAIHYRPLSDTLFLGVLGSAGFSYGDSPFYLIPAIYMRGVPAMSYQGRQVAQLEAELRWRFSSRYSAVAFAGSGLARDLSDRFGDQRTVNAGGLGIRYEIARKYGLHMGIDAAHGPEGMAYYVQFGSAWLRP
ncbi:MAG TPA: BamA/TamA family outer membrane protein [Xanthomonadales bacterium]|nr:BamA/TamA family outer membrane protein [Xanthomonadales bacterium]